MTPGAGPWAARTDEPPLFKQLEPDLSRDWRVCLCAGVLRVSSKLGSSHRTLTAPVEAGTPPCTSGILTFWRDFSIDKLDRGERRRRSFMARSISLWAVLRAISR